MRFVLSLMSGFKSNCGSESVFGRGSVVRSRCNSRNGLTNGNWFERGHGSEDTFGEASEAERENRLGSERSFMNAFGR